jgi:hypothetical protein
MSENYPKQVKRALEQLAEIDAIILKNSLKPSSGYDPYSSLINQKAGLIAFITAQMPGQVPCWTGDGYQLRDLRSSDSGVECVYFDEEVEDEDEE